MARQVAHEIKNPLTPIQLSAEHLRRVHTDRGAAAGAVLDECVDVDPAQVRLLRQIAAEFSSFASSPTRAAGRPSICRRWSTKWSTRTARAWRAHRDRHRSAAAAAAGARRSHAVRARAHQHHRERAARDAGPGRLTIDAVAVAEQRGRIAVARHRRRHGCRGAGARVRALLLDEGDRHGPGPADRESATSS